MSETLRDLHRRADGFYSEGYLKTWCLTVRREWAEFLHGAFSNIVPELLPVDSDRIVLDVGSGPSISNVISASRWSSNIILADFLESNRKEVEKFWRGDETGFSWDHYFNFAAELEPELDANTIMCRTRQAIRGVYFCDITVRGAFPSTGPVAADVIVASLVLDVVAVSEEMFQEALSNVVHQLKNGGIIIIQGSLHESVYTVGSAVFPVMNISKNSLLKVFSGCHLDLIELELCSKLSTQYFAILRKVGSDSNC